MDTPRSLLIPICARAGERGDPLGDWLVPSSDALTRHVSVFGFNLDENESPAQPPCDLPHGSRSPEWVEDYAPDPFLSTATVRPASCQVFGVVNLIVAHASLEVVFVVVNGLAEFLGISRCWLSDSCSWFSASAAYPSWASRFDDGFDEFGGEGCEVGSWEGCGGDAPEVSWILTSWVCVISRVSTLHPDGVRVILFEIF